MTLMLRIDNLDQLPDGGPIEHSVVSESFEVGRDPGMDWTLPDPNRFVSSCHLEVKFQDGGYWVYDVSTNGTFLNGGSMRMKSPHMLRSGDRMQVGHYLVLAIVSDAAQPGAEAATEPPAMQPSNDIWSVPSSSTPTPFDPTPPRPGRLPDFGDEKIELPMGESPSPFGVNEAQPPSFQPPQPGFEQDDADSPFGPASPPPEEIGQPDVAPAVADERSGSPFGAPEYTPVAAPERGGFEGPTEAAPAPEPQPEPEPAVTAPPAPKTPSCHGQSR